MKKFLSHPLFYGVFALLGIVGMLLQFWFFGTAEDAKGLLSAWHPAAILTVIVIAVTVVLTVLAMPHAQVPKFPPYVRAIGAACAAVFSAVSAWLQLKNGIFLSGIPTVLAAFCCGYVVWVQLKKERPHYVVYAVFAVALMTYLISRYQLWSAEPETARYAIQLLALVCLMLVFYQKAALHARFNQYSTYIFWRSIALTLSLTAIPGSHEPFLYLSAAIWLLLDPSARPRKREAAQGEEAQ